MNTVFKVDGNNIEVTGVGQASASAILKANKNKTVILMGFINATTRDFSPIKL